jgi:HlyD family secretion protein
VQGKVRAIAPSADPQTRNILIFVDLPRHAELKAGTFARGSFDLGSSDALTVASESVVVRDGNNYVFTIDPQNRASQLKVRTGRRVGERVEVLEGVPAEASVAVRGAGFLNEGDLVKVVPQ